MRTPVVLALLLALVARVHAVTDPLQAFAGAPMDGAVPTLEQAIGHDFAERFTRHAQLLDYCEALADASDRVRLDNYGRTHLGRRLVTLAVSSPENIRDLERIAAQNRALADPDEDAEAIIRDNPAIVWFSFSVHGNEASNSEAALALAYALAASEDDAVDSWLENVVVVIDPCLNPDGRERYVSWFETVMGREVDARRDAVEHFEPWPGGRTNHYCFDLNRDWVWGVQPESRARVEWYRHFMPQLHIDWHEQGYSSPTFFGEGDTPYNMNIPPSTKEWIADYTEAVAEGYDALGLVYATRERFDYLYPGYGKVLPCYHGAVGILNEQAGHSRGGLAIEVDEGYTLTLAERVRNQLVIARSYIEHTAARRKEQLQRFRAFFTDSMSLSDDGPAGFLIDVWPSHGQHQLLWDLCDRQGIEVYAVQKGAAVEGAVPHATGERVESMKAPGGAWWIPVDQPMGRLVRTLFERASEIEDSDTYDITGWSVPIMFGLRAWSVETPVATEKRIESVDADRWANINGAPFEHCVGTLIPNGQWEFPTALGIAAEHGLFARLTGEDITMGWMEFPAGSLLVHTIRTDDETRRAFEADLAEHAIAGSRVPDGMTDEGPVLGANANRRFVLPRIMLPRGDMFSSLSFGQVWHMLDVAYPVAHTVVPGDRAGSIETGDFNVLVLPGGNPGAFMDAETMGRWVRDGGTVVALGSSARWASRELLDLDVEDGPEDDRPALSELTYEEREQRDVEDRIPGAVFLADVDLTHPLAFGATEHIGVIKRSATPLPVGDNGYVIARFTDEPYVGGAASDRNIGRIAGTPFVTHHTLGGGNVICFSDDVTMRGFNHAGMRLLMNTITMGPSMARSLQSLGIDEHEGQDD